MILSTNSKEIYLRFINIVHFDFINLIDYVRPTARKKPDMIIIHTGTNDIQNKVNMLQKVRKVITTIKETDVNNEVQIAFSSVIHRDDQDFKEKLKESTES